MKLTLSLADGQELPPFVVDVPDNPRVESEILIGRAADCDMQISEPFISRHHCGIVVDSSAHSVRVRDRGSANGTYVNNLRIAGMCDLRDGDQLTVGFLPLTIGISEDESVWQRIGERYHKMRFLKPRRFDPVIEEGSAGKERRRDGAGPERSDRA
jgi:predicted component of type VI protein secretion system